MAHIITDEELNSLTNAILRRYDIDFTSYEPLSFKRRINYVINHFGMESVHELWVRMLKDRDFIQPFTDAITVGLTSMFRDPLVWKSLKTILRNRVISGQPINVWHAGCATGEEVYTLSILLQEIQQSHKVKAIATDINQTALETAAKGVYLKTKLPEYEKNYKQFNPFGFLQRYYKSLEKEIQMDNSLINHVTFDFHNLISDDAPGKFDIIFCRNVMIYFDHTAKKQLLSKFHNALKNDGMLIVGFYDSIINIFDKSQFTYHNQSARILKKASEVLVDS